MTQATGPNLIRKELEHLPQSPGVYRMLDAEGQVLYVGKARQLKSRVSSYVQVERLVPRLQRMVMQTAKMECTRTRTEAEALLLEANLIKSLKPRYNILLKDDKSFPYIAITPGEDVKRSGHAFPRIMKHRGTKKPGYRYFGPYASAGAVNEAIATLQKAFLLRSCSDSIFASRKRPCLEYQIKRCSAPCVDYVSKAEYAEQINAAVAFLEGKTREVQERLNAEMNEAAEALEFEKAAALRDRLEAMAKITASQGINTAKMEEADVLALAQEGERVCISVMFIRGGFTLGHRTYFPKQVEGLDAEEVMEAFIGRFYQNNTPAKRLLLSHDVYCKAVLEEALSELAGKKVALLLPLRGEKRALIETSLVNAKAALERKVTEEAGERDLLKRVAEIFDIPGEIERIEVFDNSHLFGTNAYGAMIVAGPEGFIKNGYRKFTVDPARPSSRAQPSDRGSRVAAAPRHDSIRGGDDFDMMRQVLTRRYGRLKKENPEREREGKDNIWPDLVLIDGGAGHLSVANAVFEELGIHDLPFVCIAKGPDRNAGREDYYLPDRAPFKLEKNEPVAYYLQRIRDEAHRFAISTYRAKHQKSLRKSALDSIPGIGTKRKKALLNHFGSVKLIGEASVEELMQVEGVNRKTAETILEYLV